MVHLSLRLAYHDTELGPEARRKSLCARVLQVTESRAVPDVLPECCARIRMFLAGTFLDNGVQLRIESFSPSALTALLQTSVFQARHSLGVLMSVPRSSDVSKHLARRPKRKGIVLPFPTSHVLSREIQTNEMTVKTDEELLVSDLQTIKETERSELLPETR